jgi:hypothetical protein
MNNKKLQHSIWLDDTTYKEAVALSEAFAISISGACRMAVRHLAAANRSSSSIFAVARPPTPPRPNHPNVVERLTSVAQPEAQHQQHRVNADSYSPEEQAENRKRNLELLAQERNAIRGSNNNNQRPQPNKFSQPDITDVSSFSNAAKKRLT